MIIFVKQNTELFFENMGVHGIDWRLYQ